MRILLLNPNTTEAVTTLMADAGRAAAGHGVEVKAVTASRGLPYITNRAEAQIAGAVALEMLADMREASTPPFSRPSAIRVSWARASCSISRWSALRKRRC